MNKDRLAASSSPLGKSVFAKKKIPKGDVILEFGGKLMHYSQLPLPEDMTSPGDDRYLQVSEEYFLGPSSKIDDIEDLINHSCDPNAAAIIEDKKARLVALRDIEAGEEVTYDYSPQMYNEDWTMKCECGSQNCRRIIREYKYLPIDVKNKYLKLGIVPKYNIRN